MTNWSVDTSSPVKEAWFVFKGKFSSVTSSSIPYLVQRRQVKRLLRRGKKRWNMFISTGLEKYRSRYCTIRSPDYPGTGKAP